jgi:hypothetical protein
MDRVYRMLLRVFPLDFRTDHGRDMEQTFREQRREAHREGNMVALMRLWIDTIRDVFTIAPREHLTILRQDVGYALRALRRSPVFAATAILTLAIGMSAVVAVFAIINAFMFRPLPVVHPGELLSISTRDGHAPVPHGLSFLDLQDYRARARSSPTSWATRKNQRRSTRAAAPSASPWKPSPITTFRCSACSRPLGA